MIKINLLAEGKRPVVARKGRTPSTPTPTGGGGGGDLANTLLIGTIVLGLLVAGRWWLLLNMKLSKKQDQINVAQKEVDELWEKLSAGGEPGHCGWLKDKYGLSWQIVPTVLGKMLEDENPAKARVSDAMLQMGKLDIVRLQQAYDQR